MGRFAWDPPGQALVHGQTFSAGNYSTYYSLGWVAFGTPVTLTLVWDQPNHQFVITMTNKLTHETNTATMPYTYSDTTPAAGPSKLLLASGFAANCTASTSSIYTDVSFDNVYIGH
jgi:hypothetical protein